MRGSARRSAGTSCRRSSSGARTGWPRSGMRRRAGGRAVGEGRRAGPQAGTGAQPEGRQALQAGVQRAGREGAEQLQGPREPDHEDELKGVPAVLQRAGGGGRGEPVGGRDGGDGQRERPGLADPDGRFGGGRVRRDARAGAGRRELLQRTGAERAGGAGHRRACGAGRGGKGRGGRPGATSREGAHG